MQAILIDPALHRISTIELPEDTTAMLAEMRRLIGCDTLGGGRVSNLHDQLWCDDAVFSRGLPCYAFRVKGPGVDMGPFGGKCIITGADRYGENAPPTPELLPALRQHIVWLDEIEPKVEWVEHQEKDFTRFVAVVTYRRRQS